MKRQVAILLTAALSGCTVGPNFTKPVVEGPSAYGTEPQDVHSRTYSGAVDVRWWDRFNDPELSALVDRLGRQNLDLQSAAERIRQARSERTIAASQGLPHVGAAAQYHHERDSANGTLSLITPAPGAPLEFDYYKPQIEASWELDLFGKIRRQVEAANAETEAAIEARNGVALSTIAELAQDYLELRSLQAREVVLRSDIDCANRRTALTQDRFRNGVATTLEVAQAEAQAAKTTQGLPSLHNQQAAMINAIGLLLAEPPRSLSSELTKATSQPPVPPQVPIGLPAELMRRRPDVREAEAKLHAATARTGVAVASFFPSVSLGGNFGTESLHTGTLFDWTSRAFMIGPQINLPFFQGGQLKGTLNLRKSEQREAAIDYHRTVLQAWHDVDDALTAYAEDQHVREDVEMTVAADRKALAAAEDQYKDGIATMLDVVSAQAALFEAQDQRVRSDAQIELALVALYKALGGGWETMVNIPDQNAT